jgi:phosphohistidine phosphatase SixA
MSKHEFVHDKSLTEDLVRDKVKDYADDPLISIVMQENTPQKSLLKYMNAIAELKEDSKEIVVMVHFPLVCDKRNSHYDLWFFRKEEML